MVWARFKGQVSRRGLVHYGFTTYLGVSCFAVIGGPHSFCMAGSCSGQRICILKELELILTFSCHSCYLPFPMSETLPCHLAAGFHILASTCG